MPPDIVISAEKVSKRYRLGVINHGTLYRDLQSWWAKFHGRPDPNVQIREMNDERHRLIGDIFRALDDVSFDAERGEIIGIIGRNGAGKSTLLKIISRVTAPTSGTIKLKGRVASLLEVGTGFHPELTGRENVYLNGTILGMTHREVNRKFDEIVDFAEIEDFIDTPVKRYSSGMYVRLAFSVAAHLDSDILIVDEVLAVGDVQFQKKCMNQMKSMNGSGRTILFVSHNIGAISSLCSRVIHLKQGRINFDGDVSAAVNLYASEGPRAENEGVFPATGTKAVEVTRMSVENRSDTAVYELGEDLVLNIEYIVNTDTRNVTISLQIDRDSVPIFYTYDTDLDPGLTQLRRSGTYKARLKVPAALFKEGAYTAWIKAGAGQENLTNDNAKIYFDIESSKLNTNHMSFRRDRPGMIYLPVRWETVFDGMMDAADVSALG